MNSTNRHEDQGSTGERLPTEVGEFERTPEPERPRSPAVIALSLVLVAAIGVIVYLIIRGGGTGNGGGSTGATGVTPRPGRPAGALNHEESLLATVAMVGHWTEADLVFDDESYRFGSGVVIAEDGGDLIIMTNSHCIGLPSIAKGQLEELDISQFVIAVSFHNQERLRKVSAFAETRTAGLDLALLRLPQSDLVAGKDYVVAAISSRTRASRGADVVAIGAPLSLRATETFGRISALRPIGEIRPNAVLQTDAALSPGNSGGPLFVADGEWRSLLAINTFGREGGQNLNFAYYADEYSEQRWEWFDADPAGAVKALQDIYTLKAVVAE